MNIWLGYYLVKFKGKLLGNQYHYLNIFFRKHGVNFPGGGTQEPIICCNIAKNEPYLITIGDNTVISGDVELITHDFSISRLNCGISNLFGKIVIGRNCFIGNGATILYGVTIPDNVIVAAGSVVTKSVDESNVIVAGNPAKIVSKWDVFLEKHKEYTLDKTQIMNLINSPDIDRYLVKR